MAKPKAKKEIVVKKDGNELKIYFSVATTGKDFSPLEEYGSLFQDQFCDKRTVYMSVNECYDVDEVVKHIESGEWLV